MIHSAPSSRVLLVADRRPASSDAGTVAVRRFRLARLRLEGRTTSAAAARAAKDA